MMSVRTTAAVEPVGDVTAVLGEGPYWVPEDDCLLWVDIASSHLHRTYFPSQETLTDSLPAVSAAFPVVGGGILTVGGAALTLLFPAERGRQWSTRTIAVTPARDDLRYNSPTGSVSGMCIEPAQTRPAGSTPASLNRRSSRAGVTAIVLVDHWRPRSAGKSSVSAAPPTVRIPPPTTGKAADTAGSESVRVSCDGK